MPRTISHLSAGRSGQTIAPKKKGEKKSYGQITSLGVKAPVRRKRRGKVIRRKRDKKRGGTRERERGREGWMEENGDKTEGNADETRTTTTTTTTTTVPDYSQPSTCRDVGVRRETG